MINALNARYDSFITAKRKIMKILFIASICVLGLVFQSKAQPKKSGAIQFESTFDPAAMAAANGIKLSEQALARMPKSSVSNFELLFNLNNASYTPVEDIEDSNNSGGAQGGMRFGGFGGTNKDYYYSFADHQLSEVFDLNDTTFVMQDKLGDQSQMGFGMQQEPPVITYIRTDETKKILGFNCHKVTVKTTVKRRIMEEEKVITDETNIWFTNDLGFDFSPNPGFWTEGAVLAIEGKGTHVYAKSIEFRNVSAKDVSLPKKVTPITREQLRQKMEARRKQFRGNRTGSNGQVRTITIN
jgi:GLPGLI family protein